MASLARIRPSKGRRYYLMVLPIEDYSGPADTERIAVATARRRSDLRRTGRLAETASVAPLVDQRLGAHHLSALVLR